MPGDIQRITGLGILAIVPFAFVTTGETLEVSTKGLRKFRVLGFAYAGAAIAIAADAPVTINETFDATTGIFTTPTTGTITLTRAASGHSGLTGTITLIEA